MTYGSVSKSQLSKQPIVKEPLLGNSSVDTLLPRQQANTIMEETFSVRSVPGHLRREKLVAEFGNSEGTQRTVYW
jgi:hypothetical protein